MNKNFAALRLKTLELNSPAPQFLESLNDILSHFNYNLGKAFINVYSQNFCVCRPLNEGT